MPCAAMRFCLALVLTAVLNSASDATESVEFNRDIKPILSDKCYACHGPDQGQRQGGSDDGFRLDIESGAKLDLGGYQAIVPNDLEESELIRRYIR